MPTDTLLWSHNLPAKILFIDCETTGGAMEDRMVSLGMILLETEKLTLGKASFTYLHTIFNPGRPSQLFARRVHGYDDWTLSHQELFAAHADEVKSLLKNAELMVAHNLVFDRRFLEQELTLVAQQGMKGKRRPPTPDLPPTYCTMLAHRRANPGESAKLDIVLKHWGLKARGRIHGALEDAWLCMNVFLKQHDCPFTLEVPEGMEPQPTNFITPPPKPAG